MQSADYDVSRCLSVRPFVFLLAQAGIVSKRIAKTGYFQPSCKGDKVVALKQQVALSEYHVECYDRPYKRSRAKMAKKSLLYVPNKIRSRYSIICIKQTVYYYINTVFSFTLY